MSQYTMNSGKITEAGQNVSIVSASMTDLPSNTVCSCGVSTIPALSSARIRWLRQTNVKRSAPNGPKKTSPSMISEGLVYNCIQYAASGSGSDVFSVQPRPCSRSRHANLSSVSATLTTSSTESSSSCQRVHLASQGVDSSRGSWVSFVSLSTNRHLFAFLGTATYCSREWPKPQDLFWFFAGLFDRPGFAGEIRPGPAPQPSAPQSTGRALPPAPPNGTTIPSPPTPR